MIDDAARLPRRRRQELQCDFPIEGVSHAR